jgi:hypothetical protein
MGTFELTQTEIDDFANHEPPAFSSSNSISTESLIAHRPARSLPAAPAKAKVERPVAPKWQKSFKVPTSMKQIERSEKGD